VSLKKKSFSSLLLQAGDVSADTAGYKLTAMLPM